MRRLTLAVVFLAALAPVACKKKRAVRPAKAELQSVIAMNDAAAEGQLKDGFYGLEGGSWRWTAKSFTVQLATPPNAATKGARLHLNFTIPDAVIAKLGPIELTAKLNSPGTAGLTLDPEHYAKAGTYDYSRDIDSIVFQRKGPVTIQFTCDKAIPPTGNDVRELALIASSVGLEPR